MNAMLDKPEYRGKPSVVRLLTLDEANVARWDAFVDNCPDGSFFHRAGWKTVMEQAFGHATYYVYAEQDGEIVGVLPLAHIHSRLFRNALVSTPFCVQGGALARSVEIRDQLVARACELAQQLRVDHLELRHVSAQQTDWPRKKLYVRFRKEIDPDPDVNLKAIPRKQRAMVRKGIKAGLTAQVDADTDRLFAVFSESVRNLGTPVYPQRYFRFLQEVFGDACDVVTIEDRGTPIASVMNFYFRDEVLPYYGGGTAGARQVKGNDFMYWEVMCRAAERGCRVFDYGRSKVGTGSYSFKKNWGFEPEPLNYEFYMVHGEDVPDINPLNPRYQIFIRMWQHLPLPVSQLIGPWLSRSLG